MRISVIMAACNQGKYLAETIESAIDGLRGARDWEFVVVDDCSEDGSCNTIEERYSRTQVIKTSKRSGCSASRHLAGRSATGDIIISVDPHCFFEPKCLFEMAQMAKELPGIVMPRVYWEARSAYVCGGSLGIQSRGIRNQRPSSRPAKYPTLHGTVYVMTRDVYNKLRGWPVLPGRWGRWEQMTSCWLYRMGLKAFVAMDYTCVHRQYRTNNVYPFELPKSEIMENAHWFHAMCFSETYESTWRPLLLKAYGRYNGMGRSIKSRRFAKELKWLHEKCVRSESWMLRKVLGVDDLERSKIVRSVRQWQAKHEQDSTVL